ncbi:unnamed protein product [Amoebophrya sp. A25]|nr:unnamed protein product [Amoebophrya sp. A25]|eukprot:GSA25T00017770001.1
MDVDETGSRGSPGESLVESLRPKEIPIEKMMGKLSFFEPTQELHGGEDGEDSQDEVVASSSTAWTRASTAASASRTRCSSTLSSADASMPTPKEIDVLWAAYEEKKEADVIPSSVRDEHQRMETESSGHDLLEEHACVGFEVPTLVTFAGKAHDLHEATARWRSAIVNEVRTSLLHQVELPKNVEDGTTKNKMPGDTIDTRSSIDLLIARASFAALFQRISDAGYAMEKLVSSTAGVEKVATPELVLQRIVVNLLLFAEEAPRVKTDLLRLLHHPGTAWF